MKVDEQKPDWSAAKAQAGTHAAIEFGKDDVNRNRVGVKGVNSRRIE
jgi:hypothetical protein